MAREAEGRTLSGTVEVDGAYFGGYVKPANYKWERRDRRFLESQSGKRQSVIIIRERGGRSLAFMAKREAEGIKAVAAQVVAGTVVHADDGSQWDTLDAHYEAKRINHSVCYSDGSACTNEAESYFSRLRRAEIGTHHSIAGAYLNTYASEMSWREDNRRVSNGHQAAMVTRAAMETAVSRKWAGY
jgi:hypothetical protein